MPSTLLSPDMRSTLIWRPTGFRNPGGRPFFRPDLLRVPLFIMQTRPPIRPLLLLASLLYLAPVLPGQGNNGTFPMSHPPTLPSPVRNLIHFPWLARLSM